MTSVSIFLDLIGRTYSEESSRQKPLGQIITESVKFNDCSSLYTDEAINSKEVF